MVSIYNRTYRGDLHLFPYTEQGQFKSHAAAYRYLDRLNRPYNANCIVVTQCSYDKALRLYGSL